MGSGNEFIYGKRILDVMSGPFKFAGPALVCLALATVLATSVLAAEDGITLSEAQKNDLASKFSPYLYFHPDEAYYPISPNYTIARSNLNDTSGLVHQSVTAEMLATFNSTETEYYLDNRMGTYLDDGIEKDFLQNQASNPPTVYTRVIAEEYKGQDVFIIQYWFFYPFNKGPVNAHEGDWEMIMMILDTEANPLAAAYSRHLAGETIVWDTVEKVGTHPKVCVALGSHANYFNASGGDIGIIFDQMSNSSNVLFPEEYQLIQLGEPGNRPSDQGWLEFSGYWGEYGNESSAALGQRGPRGPAYQSDGKWSEPGQWAESLEQPEENSMKMIVLASIVVLLTMLSIIAYRKHKPD